MATRGPVSERKQDLARLRALMGELRKEHNHAGAPRDRMTHEQYNFYSLFRSMLKDMPPYHANAIARMKEKLSAQGGNTGFPFEEFKEPGGKAERDVLMAHHAGLFHLLRLRMEVMRRKGTEIPKLFEGGKAHGIIEDLIIGYTMDFYLSLRNSARLGIALSPALEVAKKTVYVGPFTLERLIAANPGISVPDIVHILTKNPKSIHRPLKDIGLSPRASIKREAATLRAEYMPDGNYPGLTVGIVRMIRQRYPRDADFKYVIGNLFKL